MATREEQHEVSDENKIRTINESAALMNFDPLKPKQLEAVQSFLSGNDTFVSLPTGYGKSVIYALLPVVFDSLLGKQTAVC